MRIPLVRLSEADRPVAWWEWFFAPLVLPAVFAAGLGLLLVVVPYFALYPERHAQDLDFGTARDQELMARYRRFAARVSLPRRVVRLLTGYPVRRMIRAARRTRHRTRPAAA